jgi:hypothetical protein
LNLAPVSLREFTWPPRIEATTDQFEAVLSSSNGKLLIRVVQDGRVTTESR